MTAVFQVLDRRHTRYGKELVTAEAAIQPGLLVYLTGSGATVTRAGVANKPAGFAFGDRTKVYAPTTKVFASGEECAMIMGAGMALMSVDFFSSGSLPVTDDALYSAANGLIATSGSYQMGVCLKQVTNYQSQNLGTAQTLALVRFNFDTF